MGETRKLAAIMAVDVVGYSRLMGEDEAGTAKAVREHRQAAVPIVAGFGGRVVKTMGDGLLLEFPSVVAAVECAVTIQKMMVERNLETPEASRVVYRIGVHLGDVLVEGEDILGDGVNIAARLEGVAEPGGVCISGSAYEHIRGRIDADFVDLSERTLKNIAQPVRVYALGVGEIARASASTPTKLAAPNKRPAPPLLGIAAMLMVIAAGGWTWFIANRPAIVATGPPAPVAANAAAPAEAKHLSIVVLPLTNLSGDPAQDYFADGVTEDLTTDLSRIRNSFVIARNTAFAYKGKNLDAKAIGKELGVRYVLEGSVQRDQNRVRVNAQLIDTETGAHLWADRFEEDITDLFKLQDQVVAQLANSLGWALTKAEAEKGARSANPDAIDLSLRSWYLVNSHFYRPADEGRDMLHQARTLFERALQIDPAGIDALNGTAVTYFHDFINGGGDPGTDYDAKVLGQANRAISLAPDYPNVYSIKAIYLALTRRADEALGAADAGLALNPNIPYLYQARGLAENSLGRYEQRRPTSSGRSD
jgi:adenylate cyclase